MPNIGKYDQSKFLKAEDINVGEDYTRIVDAITEEEVGQGHDKALIPVMWFRGDYKKGMGLSAKINRNMLAHNFGSFETDDWVGRKVVFYRTMTEFQGKAVPCIRFRPKEEIKGDVAAADPFPDEPKNVLQGEDEIPY
jgi:hypothetical protein